MTIAEFLLARIAQDEAAVLNADCRCEDGQPQRPDCPDRILAECEAKRRIVSLHEAAGTYPVGDGDGPRQAYCATCGSGEPYEYPTPWPCDTLRLLALPNVDHPDYLEEWRS